VPEGVPAIIDWLAEQGRGRKEVNYRLRDWLISRQRYWGTPIPIIYCDACGIVPVPDADLPVLLPLDSAFTPTGQSPLFSDEKFLNAPCPKCGGPGRRESDTMDTFVDSSWYWYRYISPRDGERPFDPEEVSRWCPVDLYCGGIEHAILHLLYARFFTKVLRDLGLVDHGEPFVRLRNQGMILSEEGVKMSKSRGTQVDPDVIVATQGADALRLHLMYLGPWDQGGPWNDRGIAGMERLMRRAFQLVVEAAERSTPVADDSAAAVGVRRETHRAIQRVTEDLDNFQFNTAIAALIEFVNALTKQKDEPVSGTIAWREALESLTLLLAPLTPHLAEEQWERLGMPYSVHLQSWPSFDPEWVQEDVVELVVQVNGKVRERLTVSPTANGADVTALALAQGKVVETLAGREPAKLIYVPGRLVNIIVK